MGIFKNLLNKVLDAEIPFTAGFDKKSITAPNSPNDFGIKMDNESQKLENEKFREVADAIISDITNSGYFKPEKISFLAEKINKITVPGYGFRDPFSYDDSLSLDEKKALGLNTRQKFSREFIDCLSPSGLKHEDQKDIIKNIWYQNFGTINIKYGLLKMELTGLKLYVWETCGDERVCNACKVMDGKLCKIADPSVYSSNNGKTWKPRPENAPKTHPGDKDGCKCKAGCRCTATAYWQELVGDHS
jgi:hypothetical protein